MANPVTACVNAAWMLHFAEQWATRLSGKRDPVEGPVCALFTTIDRLINIEMEQREHWRSQALRRLSDIEGNKEATDAIFRQIRDALGIDDGIDLVAYIQGISAMRAPPPKTPAFVEGVPRPSPTSGGTA